MTFTVEPFWWQTNLARFLIAATLFLLVVGFVRWRSALHLRRQAVLEAEVEVRTRDLSAANERLEAASRTDFLTELPNRPAFFEFSRTELSRVARGAEPFALLLADVDHFKRINDGHGHGHDAGDRVLSSVARCVRDSLRGGDHVARWGGEEFIFLLPQTDLARAGIIAEKLRRRVEQLDCTGVAAELAVTITIGATVLADDLDIDAAIARADLALYEGKRGGRNRVEVSGPDLVAVFSAQPPALPSA